MNWLTKEQHLHPGWILLSCGISFLVADFFAGWQTQERDVARTKARDLLARATAALDEPKDSPKGN